MNEIVKEIITGILEIIVGVLWLILLALSLGTILAFLLARIWR